MKETILVVLSLIAHGICKPVMSDDNEVGTGRSLDEELEAQMIRNSVSCCLRLKVLIETISCPSYICVSDDFFQSSGGACQKNVPPLRQR